MNAAAMCLTLGNHLQDEGDLSGALEAFSRAISLEPDLSVPYFNRANLQKLRGELELAHGDYNRAIELDPSIPEYFNNRGLLIYELDDVEGARFDFEFALKLNPYFIHALNNVAIWHHSQQNYDQALHYLNEALRINPNFAATYCNRGNVFTDLSLYAEAKQDFEQAISLNPDDPQMHLAKSIACLSDSDYLQGWQLQEWRWKTTARPFVNGIPNAELWLGQADLNNKRILIQSEQGLGDTLQFARYLPILEKLGAKVIFEVEPCLIPIIQSISASLTLLPKPCSTYEHDAFDYYCPLLSLPLALKTNKDSVPYSDGPYLFADANRVKAWSARLERHEKSFSKPRPLRVGIAWAGARRPMQMFFRGFNQLRDTPLEKFAALQNTGICFYSLQKGDFAKQAIKKSRPLFNISPLTDWTDELHDFGDTAALLKNLDLIVSVDTSIVHLAGALNKPALLLNRKNTCWRWGLTEETCPWYPSVNILRQKQIGDWQDVFLIANAKLTKILTDRTYLATRD